MCGIAGFISTPGASDASALDAVRRMSDRMQAHGTDAEDLWTSKGVAPARRCWPHSSKKPSLDLVVNRPKDGLLFADGNVVV